MEALRSALQSDAKFIAQPYGDSHTAERIFQILLEREAQKLHRAGSGRTQG